MSNVWRSSINTKIDSDNASSVAEINHCVPEIGVATPARATEATANRTASKKRILLKRAIFSPPLTNVVSTIRNEIICFGF